MKIKRSVEITMRREDKREQVCRDTLRSRSLLSVFFPPVTLMDDIFIHLMTLASCLSHRFIRFIEDLVCRDVERRPQLSQFPYSVQLAIASRDICLSVKCSSSSNNPDACVYAFNSDRKETAHQRCSSVNIGSGILQKPEFSGGSYIVKGLTLPLHSFRLISRLILNCLRFSVIYSKHSRIQLMGFLSRVKRTLQGSSQDIGWLERTEGLPPVVDGTTRFMEILHDIRNGNHSLPESFVYLLIPGLFSNYGPMYFVNTKKFFSKMGLACHIVKIHSEASVERNAWELKTYIEELYWGSAGKRVLILGHSKGGVDAAAALSIYWSDLKDKVAGLALVQSPYGGSPIVSDILREGQVADREARRIMELLVKLIKGDIRALEDLTYQKRKEFITQHRLPSDHIPLVSFHTEASVSPGVLSTISHIAHAELPWLPGGSEAGVGGRRLPVVIPMAAAMAACALHLRLRYGERSDGLVTRRDAEVPGSVAVRLTRKLDHGWMVYAARWADPAEAEADACEMCEALLTLLVEIGSTKHHQTQRDHTVRMA